MTRELYPFQEEAVKFHLSARYSMNCSEMGLGKSFMALETARRAGCSPTVFGPKFLEGNWYREAEQVGVSINYIPYSKIKMHMLPVDFVILDEAHYLKNKDAQRSNDVHTFLEKKKPKYLIVMTGTPVKNRPSDFWTLLTLCSMDKTAPNGVKFSMGFYEFCNTYCVKEEMTIAGRIHFKYFGLKSLMIEPFKKLLEGKYIRFKSDSVSLPSLVTKVVDLKLKDKEDEELYKEFLYLIEGRTPITTKKVSNALIKATHTALYVQDMLDQDEGPILVFSDHVEPCKYISLRIQKSKCITGATPAQERHEAVADFQAGKIDVLVATIGSMSVGVTLTAARNVVFNDISWVPSDNAQAEKRIHRIGQTRPCFIHHIVSTPIDYMILNTVKEKQKQAEEATP